MINLQRAFLASAFTFAAATSAYAGQTGTGAVNTYTNSRGTVERMSTGHSSGSEYINGRSTSTSLKQECAAQPGSSCQYSGSIVNGAVSAYQQGVANTDPVSITTVTQQQTNFGSKSNFASSFVEKYRGTIDSRSHSAESFGTFSTR